MIQHKSSRAGLSSRPDAAPLARPGQVDSLERKQRQHHQQWADERRFDVVEWDGDFPRHGALILVDATGGPESVPLPPAESQRDRRVTIKKIDASGNDVTIEGDGAETIDGEPTLVLATQWSAATLASNGYEWFVTAMV